MLTKLSAWFFSSGRTIIEPDIRLQDVKIKTVQSYKYLGLTIDDRLSFNAHIKQLKGKLSYYCGLLYSLRNFLPIEALKSIYFALVQQHLMMHIIFWGNTSIGNLNTMQIIQNKILRLMHNYAHSYSSTKDLFKKLNLHNVSELYKIRTAIFMTCINGW